ncbi:hypothetical protein KSS87_011461 [Heliosperma pusillum]|nr:hypothetical protein KSS87_011461 [Heliosperma pusillum]
MDDLPACLGLNQRGPPEGYSIDAIASHSSFSYASSLFAKVPAPHIPQALKHDVACRLAAGLLNDILLVAGAGWPVCRLNIARLGHS